MERKEKQIGNYFVLNKELGKGSYAVCKKGCLVSDNKQLIAVKIVDKKKILSMDNKEKSSQEIEKLKREVNIQKQLKSNHIVRLLDISQTDNNLYLFLEYCNGGSLEDYLKKNGGQLSEEESCLVMEELLEAFTEMNEKNLMHRDIKPANILIHNGKIKIADFGFSRVFEESDNCQNYTTLGTPLYVTPQVLLGQKYSSKCDVWSVAAVVYELVYGHHPFYHNEKPQNITDLKNILLRKPLAFPNSPKIKPLFKDLLSKMLAIKEEERLSWKEVSLHNFFKQQEQEIENEMVKYKAEQDPFQKSLIMNDIYLKENLVAGNIVKQKLKASQAIQEQLKASQNSQQFSEQSKINDQTMEEEMFDDIKKIYEYIVFERNIAVFYYDLVRKVWKTSVNNEIYLPPNLLWRLMFCLSKIGLLFLQKVYEMIMKGQIPFFEDKKVIENFMKTGHYKNALNLLEQDLNNNTQLFSSLLFKTQGFFQDKNNIINLEKTQQDEINSFLQILDDNLQQSKEFKVCFITSIKRTLSNITKNINNCSNNALILIRYLQVGLNPYKEFKFQPENDPPAPDLRKFYQEIEKLDQAQLLQLVKDN